MTHHLAPGGALSRRKLLVWAGASASLPVLGGCVSDGEQKAGAAQGGSGRGATLRLPGVKAGVPSPFLYGGGIGYTQASYVYDTLMWKDVDGREIPWLATGHRASDDGREHTYTLRETTWSDGRPFTAADVAFTFDYLDRHRAKLAPSVITVPAPGLISAVEAVDERTVRFRLLRPDWTFPKFTGAGGVFIMPRHIWSRIPDPSKAVGTKVLVGTGPYRITSMDVASSAYRYEARDDFFGGKPRVRVIEHRPVGDPVAALRAGEVDQAGGVGPGTGLRSQVVKPFRGDPKFQVVEAPQGQTVTALYFNLAVGGALADVRFRQACARAINRSAIVEKVLGGAGRPGSPGLIPPGHPLHVDVEQYAPDRAAAEAALDAAGYRRSGSDGPRRDRSGKELSFELLMSQAQLRAVADLVVADLARLGITVRPVVVDLADFGKRRMAGRTQLSLNTFGGTATDEQPDGMGKVYASSSRSLQSAQGYRSSEIDRLVTSQRTQMTASERARTAAVMQKVVARDLPILPLMYPDLVTICRVGAVQQWSDTPGGVGGLVPSVNNKVTFIGSVPK